MAVKTVKGFPAAWGAQVVPLVEHPGPFSYIPGGEVVHSGPPFPRIFAYIAAGLSYSGTYRVDCLYPSSGLRSAVTLKWTLAATGQEVAGGTNLSGETVRLLVVGG